MQGTEPSGTPSAPGVEQRHGVTHRIVPNRKIEGFGFDEVWTYRELIFGLLYRDFMAMKNQTTSAWFWRLLQPLFTILAYTILFEHVGKVDFGTGVPYFFMMAAAMLPWQLFTSTVSGAVGSIATNAGFFGKVYFPRIILPMVSLTNALVDFILACALMLAVLVYMGMPLTPKLVFVPFFALWALVLGLALGLWLAGLNSIYRDIQHGLAYVLQLAFFISPIVYPTDAIPARFRDLYHLNPFVGIIDGFRWAFLQKGSPPGLNDLFAFALTCLFLLSGIWFFRRIERQFADVY